MNLVAPATHPPSPPPAEPASDAWVTPTLLRAALPENIGRPPPAAQRTWRRRLDPPGLLWNAAIYGTQQAFLPDHEDNVLCFEYGAHQHVYLPDTHPDTIVRLDRLPCYTWPQGGADAAPRACRIATLWSRRFVLPLPGGVALQSGHPPDWDAMPLVTAGLWGVVRKNDQAGLRDAMVLLEQLARFHPTGSDVLSPAPIWVGAEASEWLREHPAYQGKARETEEGLLRDAPDEGLRFTAIAERRGSRAMTEIGLLLLTLQPGSFVLQRAALGHESRTTSPP